VTAIHLGRRLPGASSNLPERLVRTNPETWLRTAPIRFCSRWGLPCRSRRRKRGALLPHRFTLAGFAAPQAGRKAGGLLFCGTFPGVAPAGRYPAPFVRGARTFLPAALSGQWRSAAARPTGSRCITELSVNCQQQKRKAGATNDFSGSRQKNQYRIRAHQARRSEAATHRAGRSRPSSWRPHHYRRSKRQYDPYRQSRYRDNRDG
jgi:hypothetical protein